MTTLGATDCNSMTLSTPCAASDSAESTVALAGMCCRLITRRSAVTTTSSSSCVEGSGLVCAQAALDERKTAAVNAGRKRKDHRFTQYMIRSFPPEAAQV